MSGATGLALGSAQAFFTSEESVQERLIQLIDDSHSTIDMALFRFTSRPLEQALGRAYGRGVRIRIILDGHREADRGAGELQFTLPAAVRRLDGKLGGTSGIMHHKFVLFDQKRLVTGSFNWTSGAEHTNYENALVLDDHALLHAYQQEFERLWSRAVPMKPGNPVPDDSAGILPKNMERLSNIPWEFLKDPAQKRSRGPSRRRHRRRKSLHASS